MILLCARLDLNTVSGAGSIRRAWESLADVTIGARTGRFAVCTDFAARTQTAAHTRTAAHTQTAAFSARYGSTTRLSAMAVTALEQKPAVGGRAWAGLKADAGRPNPTPGFMSGRCMV